MAYQDPYGHQNQPVPYSGVPYSPGPYSPAQYPGYGPPPQSSTNGMAIASLVVSLIGLFICGGLLCPLGAIFGHVAKGQISRTGESGEGLALAGLIIGWVGTGLVLIPLAIIIIFFGGIGAFGCLGAGSSGSY